MSLPERFRALHDDSLFLMPNAWDVGSARVIESLGFPALATTSSGFAASLGRADLQVERDELVRHVESLAEAVSVPINVDAERCYPNDPGGISTTVELLGDAGAAGFSIEDYEPGTGILPVDVATSRVIEAVAAAAPHGLVVTARAENHLYGGGDLDDTVARLTAYRAAGADVVYAPALVTASDIKRVTNEINAPVNVLKLPGVPNVKELADLEVRRVSVGGAFAFVAYGALADAATELRDSGTTSSYSGTLSKELRAMAFTT